MTRDREQRHIPEGRIPPNNLDAEHSVLGCILLDNDCIDVVTEVLGSEDWYSEANASIFECMRELRAGGAPIDSVTLRNELQTHGRLAAVGGDEYLGALLRRIPSVGNVEEHARIVHRLAVARRMILAAHEIAARGYSVGDDVAPYIDWSEQQVFAAARTHVTATRSEQAGAIAARRYGELRAHAEAGTTPGIKTGLIGLDALLQGLHAGDVILIAGRPGMGKSALAGSLALNIARTAGPVLWFSLEMSRDLCTDRLLSAEGSVHGSLIRSAKLDDDDWTRLAAAVGSLEQLRIEIDDTPSVALPAMRARARRVIAAHGSLALIVVDYLQLAKPGYSTDKREEEVAGVSRGLKELAKDMAVPVIALSQLNRDPEKRSDKRPQISDLRESGAQEQDADAIGFVYRDEVYNPSSPRKGIAEIILAKQRSGPTGTVDARFFPEFTRFDNLLEGEDVPPRNPPRPSKLEERALERQRKKQEREPEAAE